MPGSGRKKYVRATRFVASWGGRGVAVAVGAMEGCAFGAGTLFSFAGDVWLTEGAWMWLRWSHSFSRDG